MDDRFQRMTDAEIVNAAGRMRDFHPTAQDAIRQEVQRRSLAAAVASSEARPTSHVSTNPFPLLTLLSRLLRSLGWLIAMLGVAYGVLTGIVEPMMPNHGFEPSDAFDLFSGMIAAVAGLGLVAYGELIGVAFAIELNTRLAAERLTSSIRQVPAPSAS